MSRNLSLQIIRGIKANMPTLLVGESYLTTDTNEVFIGTAGGNTPVGIPTYNISGVRIANPHTVTGRVTLSGGTATVTLTGASVFSSATNYQVFTQDTSANHSILVTKSSGSVFVIKGNGSDVIDFLATGD